ncbi:MAG: glycosyltransferase [Candidatus Brocadiales bacterium]
MPNKTSSTLRQRHLKKQSKLSQGIRKRKKNTHKKMISLVHEQPSVSLCMIVKNEEKTLSRCLESVKFLVDEMVIVDTGSTDKTVEVAKGYGAKVLHKDWTDNFAEARSYAIKHVTGKWILQLDADEELEKASTSELIEIVKNKDIDGVYCIIKSIESNASHSSQFYNLRLFRNIPGIYYEGIVHETPIIGGKTVFSGIRITHHACASHPSLPSGGGEMESRRTEKLERYKISLIKQLENNPDDLRTHYYLAKTYYDQHLYDLSILEGKEVLRLISNGAPLTEAGIKTFTLLACALWQKRDFLNAERVCHQALMLKPDFADAPFLLGTLCFAQGRYDDAILNIKRFFQIRDRLEVKPDSAQKTAQVFDSHHLSIHSMTSLHQAYFMLGTIYEKQGKYAEAIEELKKSIGLEPQYIEAYYNLAIVYEKTGKPHEAIGLYRKTTELNHSFIPGLKRLGILLMENKHTEEGGAFLKKALMLESASGG